MAEMRFGIRRYNGVNLHVAEAGPAQGPVVILLHGFPEFWFGWRHQIDALADKGFRVVVPDQRGYNLSEKPRRVSAYDIDPLAGDIIALADAMGAREFSLVGHDWGAIVAWWIAQNHPARLKQLVAMDAPHPAIWRRAMDNDPAQRKLSWYVRAFSVPFLPEAMMRSGNFRALCAALRELTKPVSDLELARYREAWAMPGALTAMVNWYRAILKRKFAVPVPGSIAVPAHVVWGARDRYGLPSLAEASARLSRDGTLTMFPEATHWVQHDEPERVTALLLNVLK